MVDLNYLRELYDLKKIAEGKDRINISELERDFIFFSEYVPKKVFIVRAPKLYKLQEAESIHYREVLNALGIEANNPTKIDICGRFNHKYLDNAIIVASLQQLDSDYISNSQSYLNPLLEKIYSDGALLITGFCMHESLYGKIAVKVDDLDLKEVPLFPERFKAGKYQLFIDLDTPEKTLSKFTKLLKELEDFKKNPKKSILDQNKVKEITDAAINLRKKLGSLSRYTIKENKFKVSCNSCIINDGKNELFYMYSEKENKNVLIYFGNSPFSSKLPKDLIVLDGNKSQETMLSLLDLKILSPSPSVLKERIKDLKEVHENAVRGLGRILEQEHSTFYELFNKLKGIDEYFDQVINPDMQREYVKTLQPELLEFIVYPDSKDPIAHELLPRISWNKVAREYNNMQRFIERFESTTDQEKKKLLEDVLANILFKNQQNNAVNLWLYTYYYDFCKNNRIEFEVL